MKEKLEQKIRENINNYNIIDEIVKQKSREVQEKKNDPQLENSSIEDKIKLAQELNVDLILFISDQKIVYNRIIPYVELYIELYSILPEDISDFYKKYKIFYPKEIFIVKDEGLVEKEEGMLEKVRENYINSNSFLKSLIDSNV